jgi:hypothetical protein
MPAHPLARFGDLAFKNAVGELFAVDVERIPETKVLLTAVGGKVVHSML